MDVDSVAAQSRASVPVFHDFLPRFKVVCFGGSFRPTATSKFLPSGTISLAVFGGYCFELTKVLFLLMQNR
jgi:hypothetical protein